MLNLLKEYRGIILNSAVEPEPPFLDGAEKQQATPTPVQAQPIFMRFSESTHFPTHTGTSFYWLILA